MAALSLAPTTAWSADSKPKPIPLTPQKDALVESGRVAVMEGTVGADGHRFVLGDLTPLQPVGLVVLTQDEDADLTIELTKEFSDGPLRSARTKGKRATVVKLRTDGAFTITIRSAGQETPYQLLAWVGDPVEVEMGDVLIPVEQYDEKTLAKVPSGADARGSGDDGGTSPVMIIIAVALALIVVLLGILVVRRGKQS